jgi:hypothetical protein
VLLNYDAPWAGSREVDMGVAPAVCSHGLQSSTCFETGWRAAENACRIDRILTVTLDTRTSVRRSDVVSQVAA